MALWNAQGVQVAVGRKRAGSDNFDVETRVYGVKGHNGEPMRTDVRSHH